MNDIAAHKQESRRLAYGPILAILVTIAGYLGSQIFVGVWAGLLTIILGWSDVQMDAWLRSSVFAKFLVILVLEATYLFIIWLFLRLKQVKLSKIGLVKPVLKDIGYAVVGYIVYFAAFVVITVVAQQLVPALDVDQEQQIGFDKNTTGMALGIVFASLVILPPIAEEIIARGFLYSGLRSRWPKVFAALVTSGLFAAAHLQWDNGAPLLWVAALDTFVLSLVLVYLREKTESLWSPIMVHMIKNGFAFLLLFVFKTV